MCTEGRKKLNNSRKPLNQTGIPAQSQDLAPPPPMSTFGDTIVASNPFDDTPPAMQHSHQNGMMNHHMPHPPHHPMRNPAAGHDSSQFMPQSHYANHHNHPNNAHHPSHSSLLNNPHHPNHPNPANLPVPPVRNMMNPSMEGPGGYPGMGQMNNQQPQHVPGNAPMPMIQASEYSEHIPWLDVCRSNYLTEIGLIFSFRRNL